MTGVDRLNNAWRPWSLNTVSYLITKTCLSATMLMRFLGITRLSFPPINPQWRGGPALIGSRAHPNNTMHLQPTRIVLIFILIVNTVSQTQWTHANNEARSAINMITNYLITILTQGEKRVANALKWEKVFKLFCWTLDRPWSENNPSRGSIKHPSQGHESKISRIL